MKKGVAERMTLSTCLKPNGHLFWALPARSTDASPFPKVGMRHQSAAKPFLGALAHRARGEDVGGTKRRLSSVVFV